MAKEKKLPGVYDLYQLCSETKDLCEFCADYGVNYDKFMNWQRHQLWSGKLGKTIQVEQPKVAKVRITGKPCNSPTVKMEVKLPEGESCQSHFRFLVLHIQDFLDNLPLFSSEFDTESPVSNPGRPSNTMWG